MQMDILCLFRHMIFLGTPTLYHGYNLWSGHSKDETRAVSSFTLLKNNFLAAFSFHKKKEKSFE